jgi:hypothetical protein
MRWAGGLCFARAGLLGLALMVVRPAAAAWPTDPLANLPLCTAAGWQAYAAIVSDGAGGAIVAWEDYRDGTLDVYAQRVSAAGVVQWAADGVALCTAGGDQRYPAIVTDGAGGAIVAWQDVRNGGGSNSIFAQRISAAGTVQWANDGSQVCSRYTAFASPSLVADGAGGAIVAWRDGRSGWQNDDIYAQRISAAGAALWTATGVALCTAAGFQATTSIAADGAGGAVVAWEDDRDGSWDLYAQRVSAGGGVQWAANGVAVCAAGGAQQGAVLVGDDAGGAILAWYDYRGGAHPDLYAQRISAAGTALWATDGTPLCAAAGDQHAPAIAADGAGGAIVAWEDHRGASGDVYAQRVSATGAVQWPADGVALCAAVGDQALPAIVSDGGAPGAGAFGAIVVWQDGRSGGASPDLYAQRISAAGAFQWTSGGVALCSAAGAQQGAAIASDGAHGAILAWQDARGGSGSDLYAQRVDRYAGPARVTLPPSPTQRVTRVQNEYAIELTSPDPPQGLDIGIEFDRTPHCGGSAPREVRLVPRTGTCPAPALLGSGGLAPRLAYSGYFATDARTPTGTYDVELTCEDGSRDTVTADLHYVGYLGYQPSGRIINATTDQVIRGAWVRIWRQAGDGGYEPVSGMVAGDGSYSFDVPPGTYMVLAQCSPGSESWRGPFVVGATDAMPGASRSATPASPAALIPYEDIIVAPVTEDTEAPAYTVLSSSPTLAEERWSDAGAGLAVLEVVPGSVRNVLVGIPGFALGDSLALLTVALADSDSVGSVAIRAMDRLGNERVQDVSLSALTGVPAGSPRAAILSLAGPWPNPSAGDLVVSLSLATPEPAQLELVDVAGRVVASRRLAGLPPGRQALELRESRSAAPGVYFVRLTQGGNSVTRKVCLLR